MTIMDRIEKIAMKLVAEVGSVPNWVGTDFVNQLNLSGTPLKKYGGKFQGISTWVVKSDRKLYKDQYGWISASWTVNPVLEGQEWVVESEISFAPATSGSFAREKFEEFKQVVSISGKSGFAVFGIDRHVLTMRPDEQNALRDISGMISQHDKEMGEARKYWKKQTDLFRQRIGI